MTKKQRLKKKIDKLIQEVYYQDKCLICGQPAHCLHHFIHKKQSLALRYDEKNLIPICQSCHYKIHRIGDAEIISTIIRKKGKKWEKYIYKKRKETFKDTLTNLREIEEVLSEKKL